jgi:hypothetical protein
MYYDDENNHYHHHQDRKIRKMTEELSKALAQQAVVVSQITMEKEEIRMGHAGGNDDKQDNHDNEPNRKEVFKILSSSSSTKTTKSCCHCRCHRRRDRRWLVNKVAFVTTALILVVLIFAGMFYYIQMLHICVAAEESLSQHQHHDHHDHHDPHHGRGLLGKRRYI